MSKYIYIILTIISLKLAAGEAIIYEKKIHIDSIDSLCVNGEEIYTASFDGTIKRTIDNESKIIGKHEDWVRKVICVDSSVISASNDGMITIWKNSKKINSVQAHSWWVTDIALSGDKIVSVSLDETVKVWSYPELQLLYSHKIFGSNKHFSVIINNNKAFIGSTHGFIFVLDLNNLNKPFRKLVDWQGKSVLISSAKSLKHVLFGTSDGFIMKVLASPPYNRIYKKKISDFALKALVQSQGVLYVGDDKGILRKINIENPKILNVVNHFSEAIRTLVIDDDSIYAGYDKGYIRKFNISTEISGK